MTKKDGLSGGNVPPTFETGVLVTHRRVKKQRSTHSERGKAQSRHYIISRILDVYKAMHVIPWDSLPHCLFSACINSHHKNGGGHAECCFNKLTK